jgi:simple sugar transport system permease protein/D-ribose pyranase
MKVQEAFVNHEELAGGIAPQAKAVVRCGAFQPYGSIAIYPAINAAEWYEAEGTVVPDLYKDRV